MKTYIHRVSVVLAVVVLAACGSDRSVSSQQDAVLSDARSDGAAGFYFLPPIAPEPGSGTVNDPGLSPEVRIDALGADGAVIGMLAEFEGDAVKASGSHYMVHWSTRRYVPLNGTTYRIRVLLDGEELGFADAKVARGGRELRLLASQEVFGLTGRRTVPIKFRIHVEPEPTCAEGTACDDGDACTQSDACDAVGVCTGASAACASDQCNDRACDPEVGCITTPKEPGTNCIQTSGEWAGTPGECALDPESGEGYCADITPSKMSR